ncbi:MAG: STAS domain-containing protein, partial [Erysipelotrichaceae bacterium]
MKHKLIGNTLYFYFYGDLDNLTLSNLKQICIDLIDRYHPAIVKMDFEEISFVDSTGIGFVLARYKQLSKYHARLILCNLSTSNKALFHMSGIFQIIEYER